MDIILIHLGPNIPSYLPVCIRQIRKFTADRIILGLSSPEEPIHGVENVLTYHLSNLTENWAVFERINHLNGFGMDGFWKYACARFYAIEAIMERCNLSCALHIENDNLIYGPPQWDYLKSHFGNCIGLPELNEIEITAGVMYVGCFRAIDNLCRKLNQLFQRGLPALKAEYGGDMMHEMRLLRIVSDISPGIIKSLPIFPVSPSTYVYDPASWGQYVGGTVAAPGEPYVGGHHFIGRQIGEGHYTVSWELVGGINRPFVQVAKGSPEMKTPLFNLHIHSKQLQRWAS